MFNSFSKLRLELTVALLLGSFHLIQAAPSYDSNRSTRVRNDNLPRERQLVKRNKETIPWRDGENVEIYAGDEWWNEDYKSYEDYDPDQDYYFGDILSSPPKGPPKSGTGILRSIKINGQFFLSIICNCTLSKECFLRMKS